MTDMNNPTNQSSTSGKAANADQVLDTLNQVFAAFQDKIKNQGPKPFEGEAENAVNVFNDILAGLQLKFKPETPSGFAAKAVSSEQIDLTWADPGSRNSDGYKLERSESNSGGFDEIADLKASDFKFSDTKLKKDTTYYYRLRAFNARGDSAYVTVYTKTHK